MIAKVCLCFTILVAYFITLNETISIHSIVRLRCRYCVPDPYKCCVGTVILPDFILTTLFCAQSCQHVKMYGQDIPIKKIFTHEHFKNFIVSQQFIKRNDVALINTGYHNGYDGKYLGLSAIDVSAAIGKKALIPILEYAKPRLLVTLIKGCEDLTGYYVCSTKVDKKEKKNCQQEEGMPLLLDQKVIGITSQLERKDCHLQKTFIAVGPAQSWINSIVYQNSKHLMNNRSPAVLYPTKGINIESEDSRNHLRVKPAYRPVMRADLEKSTDTKNNSFESIVNNTLFLEETTSISKNTWSLMTEPELTRIELSELDPQYKNYSHLLSQLLKKDQKIFKTKRSTPVTNTVKTTTSPHPKTKFKRFTAITANLNLLTTTTIPTTTTKSSTKSVKNDTIIRIELFQRNANLSTSVMDWFNQKYKDKLKKSPPPVLVLTTKHVFWPTKKFEDLT